MNFNQLDYFCLLLALISALVGVLRGFIKELMLLVSFLIAIFASLFFRSHLMFLFNFIRSDLIKESIAAALIFFVMMIIGSITVRFIYKTISIRNFGSFIDRLLGFIYGTTRSFLIILLLASVLFKISDHHNAVSNKKPENWPKINAKWGKLINEQLKKSRVIAQVRLVTIRFLDACLYADVKKAGLID